MSKVWMLLVVVLGLTGCAFNKQNVTLQPMLNVASSSEGAGKTVWLRVVDDRPSTSLGHRGGAGGAAAEITTSQDMEVLVEANIRDGLYKRGYNVVDDPSQQRQLLVELRELLYSTSTGFWTGGVEVNGAMKVVAKGPGGAYEKMYRSTNKQRVVIVPTADTNAEWINATLSDLLAKLFDDPAVANTLSH